MRLNVVVLTILVIYLTIVNFVGVVYRHGRRRSKVFLKSITLEQVSVPDLIALELWLML